MRLPKLPKFRLPSFFNQDPPKGVPPQPYRGPGVPPEVKENRLLKEENEELRFRAKGSYFKGVGHGVVLSIILVVALGIAYFFNSLSPSVAPRFPTIYDPDTHLLNRFPDIGDVRVVCGGHGVQVGDMTCRVTVPGVVVYEYESCDPTDLTSTRIHCEPWTVVDPDSGDTDQIP